MQPPVSANEGSPDASLAPGTGSDATAVPLWHLGLWWSASVVTAVLHNGLWATPNLGFMAHIAQNPGTNPFPPSLPGDYLLTGVSMPSVAALLGQTQPHEVARLHLLALLACWAALVLLARRRFGHATARNLTVLLAASPLVTASMQWLGQPDPVTAACGIAMVLVRRWWAILALGILAGLTHPEQAVLMALAAGAVRALLPRDPTGAAEPDAGVEARRLSSGARGAAVAVGGVLAGRLLTQIWFWIRDIRIRVPRTDYVDSGLATFWEHHTQDPLALVWSLWGPLWLLLPALAFMGLTGRLVTDLPAGWRRAIWGAAAICTAALLPVFVTLDETRVYAVLTAPVIAGLAVWLSSVVQGLTAGRAAATFLLVTALLPGTMATGTSSTRGDLDTPAMLSFLANGSVPARYEDPVDGPLVTEWLIEPFDIVVDDPGS